MNETYYKNTFSKLHPSDVTVERIFDMSEKKQIRFCKKGIIALIVILSIFLATCICADAATDGALRKEVKNILNGEGKINPAEYDYVAKRESNIDENGNTTTKVVIEDLGGNSIGEYRITRSNSSENMEADTKIGFLLQFVDDNGCEKIYEIVDDGSKTELFEIDDKIN